MTKKKRSLTNKKIFKKFHDYSVDVGNEVLYTSDGMRAAHDRGFKDALKEAYIAFREFYISTTNISELMSDLVDIEVNIETEDPDR